MFVDVLADHQHHLVLHLAPVVELFLSECVDDDVDQLLHRLVGDEADELVHDGQGNGRRYG